MFLYHCFVPNEWRFAIITPLYKKGPRTDPYNYRPISLTSHLSKIFETVIYLHIFNYLTEYNLISVNQHGFRAGFSTTTNLLDYYAKIYNSFDKNVPVDGIFFYFIKAFDQVHHPLLIHKLKSLGVAGPVANWIQNWLSGRSQKVVVQGCMSDKVSVTSGTVQGSVLGPLLFLMYVDDFGNGTQSFNNKYADDTKFQNDVHSAVSAVVFQSDLNLLHQWCDLWKLNIHPEKSKVMHFGRSNPINTYFWGLNKLTSSNQLSDLGYWLILI